MNNFFKFFIYIIIPVVLMILDETGKLEQILGPASTGSLFVKLISIYFMLLGFILLLDLKTTKSELLSELKDATGFLRKNTKCERIADNVFYQDFLHEAKKATSLVNICYFSPLPPDSTKDEIRKKYYSELKRLIKNSKVKFRRIVRYTEANKRWIKEMLDEFDGVSNFDLAIIHDTPNEDIKMSFPLSVQVIDKRKCWMVAIESHEKESIHRDLFIEGDEIGEAMSGYFVRLWNLSEELISSGRLTTNGKTIQNS